MIRIRLKINHFILRLQRHLDNRFAVVGKHLVREIKDKTSKPTSVFGPSKAGEYPHYDTGAFHGSLYWKKIKKGVRVGALVSYALQLEKTRPWLNRTIRANRKFIMRTITKKRF